MSLSCLHSSADDPPTPPWQDRSHKAPSVKEMSTLIIFLLDVLPLVKRKKKHTHLQSSNVLYKKSHLFSIS